MKKIVIEIENDLHNALVVDSKKNRRSLKQHTLWLIEQHIAQSCALPPVLSPQMQPTNENHGDLERHITNFYKTETLGLSRNDALQSYDSFIDGQFHWLVLDDLLEYLRSVGTTQVRRDRVVQQLAQMGWKLERISVCDTIANNIQERSYYYKIVTGGDD